MHSQAFAPGCGERTQRLLGVAVRLPLVRLGGWSLARVLPPLEPSGAGGQGPMPWQGRILRSAT